MHIDIHMCVYTYVCIHVYIHMQIDLYIHTIRIHVYTLIRQYSGQPSLESLGSKLPDLVGPVVRTEFRGHLDELKGDPM